MRHALLAFCLGAGAAHAQQVRITGEVRHPATLSVDALRALPGHTVDWPAETGQAPRTAAFAGPLLWDVVRQAEPVDRPGEGAAGRSHLQHVVIARGRDGYAVAIAIGEIDPEFAGKPLVIGLPREGQDDIRLAVPGDRRAGRGVRDLVELEVR